MDEYYARMVREMMSEAMAELVKVENYLIKADAPRYMIDNVRRMMSGLRSRQNEIADIIISQSKRES